MCRSAENTKDGKQKRCDKCNSPARRRGRQNLANAVRREQAALEAQEASSKTPAEEIPKPVTPEPEKVQPEPKPEPKPEPEVTPEPETPDMEPEVEPEPEGDTKDEEESEQVEPPKNLADALTATVQELDQEGEIKLDPETIKETISSMLASPEVGQKLSAKMRAEREEAGSGEAWILNGRENTPENIAAGVAERQQEILMVGTVIAERAQAIHGIDLDQARAEWAARVPVAKAEYDKAVAAAKVTADAYTEARAALLKKYDTNYYEYTEKATSEEIADLEVLRQANNVTLTAREDARQHLQKTILGKDEASIAVTNKIASANRQAIAEVRPVGNVPVAISENIRGGDAGRDFKATISSTFPDEWVESSNELGELSIVRVTKSDGRAHYEPVRRTTAKYNYSMPKRPNLEDDRFKGWTERVDENGNGTGTWEGPRRDFLEERNPWNMKKFNGTKPKGAGWRRGQAEGTYGPVHGWVRENATDQKNIEKLRTSGAKITVNMNADDRERSRTNQHEFAHRIEDARPHIMLMEEGFVASRTTGADGRRDPLRRYTSNSKKPEYVRPDNFVDSYIGKEYEGHGFRELLSMGSESVFGGSKGGLIGIGTERTDPEMRNWILGAYATL